jgi:hypothetical protein
VAEAIRDPARRFSNGFGKPSQAAEKTAIIERVLYALGARARR